jgi:glycosyltransferase involved in cell wall biosynthesis
MHIGIDIRLPHYQVGGISNYVVNLVKALAELGSQHRFTAFHSRKDGRSYVNPTMNRFVRADLWTPCHHRLERWSLGVELLPHQLQLLHSPDFIPPAFGARCRVITVHDLNFLLFPEFLTAESRRYYNEQIDWAVRQADHILADSHHTRSDLINRLSVEPDRVTTVHLAASPIFEKNHSTEEIDGTLTRYLLEPGFILFVGTLSPRKNVKTVLEAFERLVIAGADETKLVLAGAKGWLSDELFASIADSDFRDRIRHMPDLSDAQMAHLYSSAAALVIPSFYEGFGLPALEAMHCGCPVIASNQSSLPEVVGEAAIQLEPHDTVGWAEAMMLLISDDAERKRLADLGTIQARKFSWRNTAEATLSIYERCLNN